LEKKMGWRKVRNHIFVGVEMGNLQE